MIESGLIKMPFPEYLSLPYLSNSGLKRFVSDPADYLLSFQESRKSTPAQDEGSAAHSRVLEPETYLDVVACHPEIPRRSEEQKAYWAKFEEANKGKIILKPEIVDEVEFLVAAVKSNSRAMDLLSGGRAEMTGIWEDPRGFMCKIRMDYIKRDDFEDVVDITDIKTVADDISIKAFTREIENRLYHWQAYFYCSGGYFIVRPRPHRVRFHFIALSKARRRCKVYSISDVDMEEVGGRIEDHLDRYAEYMRKPIEQWFVDNEESIELHPWAA